MSEIISAISLFSGCGGMDLGFILEGFNISWAVDKDLKACETYRFNIGNQIKCLDINLIDLGSIPNSDILICGPPCQGFSNIGKRDINDKRNSLYLDVLKVIQVKKPKFIVIENVKGVLSFQKGEILNNLIQKLETYDYKVEWEVLNAKDYGISQNRERVFVIANNIGFKNFFNNLKKHKTETLPLRNVIGDIEELDTLPNHIISKNYNPKYNNILFKIGQGQKLCDTRLGKRSVHTWQIPEYFGETTNLERLLLYTIAKSRRLKRYRKEESWNDASPLSEKELSDLLGENYTSSLLNRLIEKNYIKEKFPGLFDLKHTFNGKFRRLSYNKPSEAILTNFGSPRNYIHPTLNRPLTARECARIQGFADSFVLKGSPSDNYKQIGNAVPPKLSQIIAIEIKAILLRNSNTHLTNPPLNQNFSPYAINEVIRRIRIYKTPDLGNYKDPLNELVYLYISQRTFEKSYKTVFKALKKVYPSFDKLRCAKNRDLEQILEPSGLPKQKAKAIIDSLNIINKDFGAMSLRKLKDYDDTFILDYLLSLPRVGIKTAYCILLFCYKKDVLPIDANIRRVCRRLGWLPKIKNSLVEHGFLHSLIEPRYRYEFHVNCITHGRDQCLPLHPKCDSCCINEFCPHRKDFK
jgi:DNA (cytosine-5)-methyltransferase 1